MIALNARFDGRVLIPDEPLALTPNQKVRIELEPIESAPAETGGKPKRVFGQQKGVVLYIAPEFESCR
jgi:hypothetical protein